MQQDKREATSSARGAGVAPGIKPKHTIFTRFLKALGVPHTSEYSDRQFEQMTFKSLYGLSHLLDTYHVDNEAWQLRNISEVAGLTPPFLAQSRRGVFVIVTDVDVKGNRVRYDTMGLCEEAALDKLESALNGVVLLAYPTAESSEPDYRSHRVSEFVSNASGYMLAAAVVVLFAYLFVSRRLYDSVSGVLLTVFDCVGLYLSFLLMQKSLGIHTKAQDKVCSVLERGGCDSILKLKVSKLFGVFSWSEVGFGYFGVSLATLLLFPDMLPELALCNVCCLPYTIWSISYQRFVAHHWCTLCVGVQTTLWLLFFSYLLSGAWSGLLPLRWDLFALLAAYVMMVLSLNRLTRMFTSRQTANDIG